MVRSESDALTGSYDALVVGAGPNGLSAAIAIAQTGRSVLVVEGQDTVGGGARSAELTLPGFLHDVCSAIHPLAVGSPFLVHAAAVRARAGVGPPSRAGGAPARRRHCRDDGALGRRDRRRPGTDAESYRKLFGPLVRNWDKLSSDVIGPLRFPRHPLLTAHFGLLGLRSAVSVAQSHFEGERARALFAGIAAHSVLPLERAASAAVGLVLGASGHAVGWPMPRGGAQRIADALASYLTSLGGRIETGVTVRAWTTCQTRLSPCSTSRRDRSSRSLETACPTATGASSRRTATDQRPSRSTGRWTGRCHGAPLSARGQARCTWAVRWPRSPTPSARCGTDDTRSGPSCCSPSRACSTRPEHQRASTRPGPTATSRTAQTSI